MRASSPEEREELFTSVFDVSPACVPYVSVHLLGEENFKRGAFMAALHRRYQETGFSTGGELPDHLAVLLRFAAETHEAERRELVQFCLLGPLDRMIEALAAENPYCGLLATVREVLRAAYPDLEPAPSPREQRQRPGVSCGATSSACGCGAVLDHGARASARSSAGEERGTGDNPVPSPVQESRRTEVRAPARARPDTALPH